MHGYKRSDYKARQRDPTVSAALEQKASQWNILTSNLAKKRLDDSDSSTNKFMKEDLQKILSVTEKLLTVNPDPLYLYNHRREVLVLLVQNQAVHLQDNYDPDSDSGPNDGLTALFDMTHELKVSTACLKRNPKAYGAWFHRKWAIQYFMKMSGAGADGRRHRSNIKRVLDEELGLCSYFLSKDERNFHCWNYRRFIISGQIACTNRGAKIPVADGAWSLKNGTGICTGQVNMGTQLLSLPMQRELEKTSRSDDSFQECIEDISKDIVDLLMSEWAFTTLKIEDNFSNYSAFHYRSKLLPFIYQSQKQIKTWLELVTEELEIINQAIFTEPDDQSAWWYYRFIISEMMKSEESRTDESLALLDGQCDSFRELVEAEDGKCKWGLIALQTTLLWKNETFGLDNESIQEYDQILDQLMELDPNRAARYS